MIDRIICFVAGFLLGTNVAIIMISLCMIAKWDREEDDHGKEG